MNKRSQALHSLLVHPGEYFKRSRLRRIVFGVLVVCVALISVLGQGNSGTFSLVANIFAFVIVLGVSGGYIWSKYHIEHTELPIELTDSGVNIGTINHARSSLEGFFYEHDITNDCLKNIVFVTSRGPFIYSLSGNQTPEQLHEFEYRLLKQTKKIDTYEYTFLQKIMRKCKV